MQLQRCNKLRCEHLSYGLGYITAASGDPNRPAGVYPMDLYDRVRFDRATKGERVRVFKMATLAWYQGTRPAQKVQKPATGELREVAKRLAERYYARTLQAPGKTAAERVFREFYIGLIAGHQGLIARAVRSLKTIARKSCAGIVIPLNTSWQKPKRPGQKYFGFPLPEGGELHTDDMVALFCARALRGDVLLPEKNYGTKMRNQKIDELRKATAQKRQPVHDLEDDSPLVQEGVAQAQGGELGKTDTTDGFKTKVSGGFGIGGSAARKIRKARDAKPLPKRPGRKPSVTTLHRRKMVNEVIVGVKPWKLRPIKGLEVPEE